MKEKVKNGITELVFILDRSGSMSGLERDTIGGFNSMIEKQKEVEGDANITLVCFDHEYELIYDNCNIKEVLALTNKEYCPRGLTALYDAIGRTIDTISHRLNNTPEEERPEKVIVSITTDGMENASKEYTFQQVKEKIEHQQEKYNWEFIFLGADLASVKVATNLGINPDFAATWTTSAVGMASHAEGMNKVLATMRNADYTRDVNNAAYKAVGEALSSIAISNTSK